MADYVVVDTNGWFDDIVSASSISGTYTNYSDVPNEYITRCAASSYQGSIGNYNNERELYDLLITEAYNKHGVCMDYYITTFDKSYDKIYGEDNNRSFTRRFQIMGSFRLPREEKLWTKFGIEGMDQFSVFVSKRHFWEASQYDYTQTNKNAYSPYVPKAGDYIISKYNKYVYEIVEVKDEEMMYLHSKQHVWELMVKPFKDEHIITTALTSASDMSAATNQSTDKYDITKVIDNKKGDIKYTPKTGETGNQDPYSGW